MRFSAQPKLRPPPTEPVANVGAGFPLGTHLNGFHELDLKIAIRLAAARTHLEPVVDFPFHLSHSFVSRGARHSDGPDTLARMFDRPDASIL